MKNKLHQLKSLIIILITLSISSCTSTEETPTNEEQYTGHKLGVKESVFFNLDNLQEKGNIIENQTDFAQRLNLSKAYYNKMDEKEVFFAPVRMFGDYPRDYLYTKINNSITERFFTYIGEDKKEIHIHDLNGTLVDIIRINSKGIGSSILRKPKARHSELCPTTIYIKCSSGQHSLENPVEAESCNYWEDSRKGSPPSMFIQFSSCGAPILGGGGPGLEDTESEEDSILLPGGGTGGGTPVTDRCLVRTDCDYCPNLNMTVTKKECEDKIVNYLSNKSKCVYDKISEVNLVRKVIEKFNGRTAPVDLILIEGILNDDTSGQTTYGDSITITLNSNDTQNTPSLWVAHTILHEMIHADLFRLIRSTSQLVYDQHTKMFSLPDGSRANFPTLFDYFNTYPSNPQHNLMADYYLEAMEHGLKEYAKLTGKEYPQQLYKDLAWAGLQNTNSWNNMFADKKYTEQEQKRILRSIIKFKKSGKNECS